MYGAFLRRVRESRQLSQSELAAITGIPQPSLSAYENDRRAPTIDTLNRIVVGCGYVVEAVAGRERIACPLPRAGWFPDDAWRPDTGDARAVAEPPTIGLDADPIERAEHVEQVLNLGDALREAKALP
jgi:transcriptional regulator with XRE-family HTH domain